MPRPNSAAIRRARMLKPLEVTDLAALVGVSYQHMANIENGHNQASVTILGAIAEALDLTMRDVLAVEGLPTVDAA